MLSADEDDVDRITAVFHRIMEGQELDGLEIPPGLPDNEIRQLTEYVNKFLHEYQPTVEFTQALARGDLDATAPAGHLRLLQALKGLQANLRHLTWKTQQIAKGDFSQRVDFMGAFSASFNSMVTQLETAHTVLTEKNSQLEKASRTDPLTGLLNRRGLAELLRAEIERSERYANPFAVMIADIDYFKRVNDSCGHEAGDALLVRAAQVFREGTRQTDRCARWGGEEFLVLLPETELLPALTLTERLRSSMEYTQIEHRGDTLGATISVGVVGYARDESADDCIRRADHCLYRAKESGRNQVWYQETPESLARFASGRREALSP